MATCVSRDRLTDLQLCTHLKRHRVCWRMHSTRYINNIYKIEVVQCMHVGIFITVKQSLPASLQPQSVVSTTPHVSHISNSMFSHVVNCFFILKILTGVSINLFTLDLARHECRGRCMYRYSCEAVCHVVLTRHECILQ